MVEIFLIIGLLLYIGFLHYQLIKRKDKVDSFKKSEEDTRDWSNIKNYSSDHFKEGSHRSINPALREDFFSEENLEFIFDRSNTKVFLHYTSEQSVADKILSGGFKFVTSFYKTAEEVYPDLTDLVYKHNKMKAYGRFVIIICIDNILFNEYLEKIQEISSYDIFVEQILTEVPSYVNEEGDVIYTLHHKFIKGYIDYKTGEIIKNPDFDPSYYSPVFDRNIKKFSH